MRRVLMTAAAAATLAFATSANATVTLNTTNGNLSTKIQADQGDGNTHDIVWGSYDGKVTQNVSYDGNVDIAITGGSGFAEIDPGNGVTNFTSLVIDPTDNFTQYEFSIQTLADAHISVYYMLASGGGWQLITGGPLADPFSQAANGNNNYLIDSSAPLTALMITSDVGIKFVKQNSITISNTAVPEPASWGLMLLGFAGVGVAMRRSRKRKPALMQVA